jgi:hypothetical protein
MLDAKTLDKLEAWWDGLSADEQALIDEHAAMPFTRDEHVRELVERSSYQMRRGIDRSGSDPPAWPYRMPDVILEFLADPRTGRKGSTPS